MLIVGESEEISSSIINISVSGQIPAVKYPPDKYPPDKYPRNFTHHSKKVIKYRKIKVHFFKKIYIYLYTYYIVSIIYNIFFWIVGT